MAANQAIVLQGRLGDGSHVEKLANDANVRPGFILEELSTGKVQNHSTRGGIWGGLVAKEDYLRGGNRDGTLQSSLSYYASGDPVLCHRGQRNEKLNLKLAIGESVTKEDWLISKGNGRVCKAASAVLTNIVADSAAAGTSSATIQTFSNGTYTLPANVLKVGDLIRIRGSGIFPATNSTDTAIITLKIGATVIVASTALDVANNDTFAFDATLVVRTIGATGTIVGFTNYTVGTPGTATSREGNLASTTIDTTATQAITVNVTFNNSSAGNSAVLNTFYVDQSSPGAGVSSSQNFIGQADETIDATSAEQFCATLIR